MPNQFLSLEGDLENYFVSEYWLIDQWIGDELWTWGFNNVGQLGDNTTTQRNTPSTTFAGGTNWSQISAGNNHSLALKTDGTLWTWGNNANGQLGDNTITNKLTPITTFAGGTNWHLQEELTGNKFLAEEVIHQQLKLMVLYGFGEIILKHNWELMKEEQRQIELLQ